MMILDYLDKLLDAGDPGAKELLDKIKTITSPDVIETLVAKFLQHFLQQRAAIDFVESDIGGYDAAATAEMYSRKIGC